MNFFYHIYLIKGYSLSLFYFKIIRRQRLIKNNENKKIV